MMTDDAAFLHEIAENPDELGPRLRYADYLDEKLDSASALQAEFIRVQCALEHLSEDDPSFASLAEREREILDANWHLWMRPICQAIGEPLPVPPLNRTWGERPVGGCARCNRATTFPGWNCFGLTSRSQGTSLLSRSRRAGRIARF